MIRILFFVFLAFLVWLAIRVVGGSRRRDDVPSPVAPPSPATAARAGIETIAQCAWCGVHVPSSTAIAVPDGRIYCSDAHRDAARGIAPPVDAGRS